MTTLETILTLGVIVAMLIIIALVKYAQREHQLRLEKATSAYRLGASQKVGDFSQVLGTFSMLTEYEEVLLLSSTSAQSSLDLIGLKRNQLDFIEFKKEGSPLTGGQRRLKNLIDTKQLGINYKVIDVRLPAGTEIKSRD